MNLEREERHLTESGWVRRLHAAGDLRGFIGETSTRSWRRALRACLAALEDRVAHWVVAAWQFLNTRRIVAKQSNSFDSSCVHKSNRTKTGKAPLPVASQSQTFPPSRTCTMNTG